MEKKKTTTTKVTETAREARRFIKWEHQRAHEAKARGDKVAWVMVEVPGDIIRAMDVYAVWPESYSSLCAAKAVEASYIDKARAEGYANFLCNYSSTNLGYALTMEQLGEIPPEAPDGGLPQPDMLLAISEICDPRIRWFVALQRYLKVPLFIFEGLFPQKDLEEVVKWDSLKYTDLKGYIKARGFEHWLRCQKAELERLVAFLEQQTGKKMDWDRLRQFVRTQWEIEKTWSEVLGLAKAVPCPLPAGDTFSAVYPMMYFMGEPEALDFYKRLYAEVKNRVDNKVGSIPDEKYRLVWIAGVPPWHSMDILHYFERYGAVVAFQAAYAVHAALPLEFNDPLEAVAMRRLFRESYNLRSAYLPLERIPQYLEEYSADGIIMHATRTCHTATVGHRFQKRWLEDHGVKIPTLIFEGDQVDRREWNEGLVSQQIDEFMEAVATNKEKRKEV